MSTPTIEVESVPGFPPEREIPPLDFVVYRDADGEYWARVIYGGFTVQEKPISLMPGQSFTMSTRLR